MISPSQTAPAPRPYQWRWLGAIVLSAFALVYLLFVRSQVPTFTIKNEAVPGKSVDTYLILRMPAIPAHDQAVSRRVEEWFAGMKSAGYRPLLLSDVHSRLKSGAGVPDKTVVLVFDPGYRQTFDVVGPLLAKYEFPAVWVTHAEPRSNRDMRYVSNHVLNGMKKSGTWDVGRYEDSALVIESQGAAPLVIGKEAGAWREAAGRRAMNQGLPEGALSRLNVNGNWTQQQMIDRLQTERPLRGKGFLAFKKLQNQNWGVIAPTPESAAFTLKTPLDARTAGLSWLGTRGLKDLQLDMKIENMSGELWLLLRSDEETGEHVGICFDNGTFYVTQQERFQSRYLLTVSEPALRQPASFSAVVSINGSNVSVSINGVQQARVGGLSRPASNDGILRLKLYDKIMGAAFVESVKLGVSSPEKNSTESELR